MASPMSDVNADEDSMMSYTEGGEDRFPSSEQMSTSSGRGVLMDCVLDQEVVQRKRKDGSRLNQELSNQGNGQRDAAHSTLKWAFGPGVTPALLPKPDSVQRFHNNQRQLQEVSRDPACFNERLSSKHTNYLHDDVTQTKSSAMSIGSSHCACRVYVVTPVIRLPGHEHIAAVTNCCIQPAVPSRVGEDSPSLVKYVYNQWDPMPYLLPDVKRDGFPTKKLLLSTRRVADSILIYCNEEFAKEANLSCGANVKYLFPSPSSVRRSTPVSRQPQFFQTMDDERRELVLDVDIGDQATNVVDAGGNGVVYSLMINGQLYAVKLSRYNKRELDFWYRAVHPNVLPLLAVVWLSPGYCYLVMPKMAGNLSSLLHSVGDLADFAFREDDKGQWKTVVIPNLQHLLTSILRGLAYIHEKGFQHCDLKESNILYTTECGCSNIFCCECEPRSAKIVISDFDSVKPFCTERAQGAQARATTNCGTPYYRPPELFEGLVTPYGDSWSLGIIICRLFQNHDEKKKLIESCHDKAIYYPHLPNSLPSSELFFGQEILQSLQRKSYEALCAHMGAQCLLRAMARIACYCINLGDYKKRKKAKALLKDPFFLI